MTTKAKVRLNWRDEQMKRRYEAFSHVYGLRTVLFDFYKEEDCEFKRAKRLRAQTHRDAMFPTKGFPDGDGFYERCCDCSQEKSYFRKRKENLGKHKLSYLRGRWRPSEELDLVPLKEAVHLLEELLDLPVNNDQEGKAFAGQVTETYVRHAITSVADRDLIRAYEKMHSSVLVRPFVYESLRQELDRTSIIVGYGGTVKAPVGKQLVDILVDGQPFSESLRIASVGLEVGVFSEKDMMKFIRHRKQKIMGDQSESTPC